jgi:hypothetical protein
MIDNKGTLLLRLNSFCPYLVSQCTRVTEALPTHVLQAVQATLKLFCILKSKEFFIPISPLSVAGWFECSRVALSVRVVKAVEVRLKSVSNGGQFTLGAETVSCPYLSSHCSRVTVTPHVAHPVHELRAVEVKFKTGQ